MNSLTGLKDLLRRTAPVATNVTPIPEEPRSTQLLSVRVNIRLSLCDKASSEASSQVYGATYLLADPNAAPDMHKLHTALNESIRSSLSLLGFTLEPVK